MSGSELQWNNKFTLIGAILNNTLQCPDTDQWQEKRHYASSMKLTGCSLPKCQKYKYKFQKLWFSAADYMAMCLKWKAISSVSPPSVKLCDLASHATVVILCRSQAHWCNNEEMFSWTVNTIISLLLRTDVENCNALAKCCCLHCLNHIWLCR